ncbi:MAG: hypothetical protein AAF494_01820 [Pseudomonadota bacterium]
MSRLLDKVRKTAREIDELEGSGTALREAVLGPLLLLAFCLLAAGIAALGE